MRRKIQRYYWLFRELARGVGAVCPAQQPAQSGTWENVKDRFEQQNPTLLADKLSVDESKADEITAFLRPNPEFNLTVDGTQIAPNQGVWKPFAGTFE